MVKYDTLPGLLSPDLGRHPQQAEHRPPLLVHWRQGTGLWGCGSEFGRARLHRSCRSPARSTQCFGEETQYDIHANEWLKIWGEGLIAPLLLLFCNERVMLLSAMSTSCGAGGDAGCGGHPYLAVGLCVTLGWECGAIVWSVRGFLQPQMTNGATTNEEFANQAYG